MANGNSTAGFLRSKENKMISWGAWLFLFEQTQYYRDTWAEVDLDALHRNLVNVRKLLPRETELFTAVKANAYGHGDIQVAQEALRAGTHGFVVATLDEALHLRQQGIEAPILVLGIIRPTDAGIAARKRISVPVFQEEWLDEAAACIQEDGPKLRVHIKCDTGMGRIGLRKLDELKKVEERITGSACFALEGIFTHFATADSPTDAYYLKQLETFRHFVAALNVSPRYVHAANSAAALCHDDSLFNAVRIGIAIYGMSPSEERPSITGGEQAFSLHSKLVHVKKMQAEESVSYGAGYTAQEGEWIATLPIGYADGWIRKLEGQRIIVGGEEAKIVGRICMDQTMVRLPHYMPVGTQATLIGKQGRHFISMEEIAQKLETINYEVPCMIGGRVPRVYKRNGGTISVTNKIFDEKAK